MEESSPLRNVEITEELNESSASEFQSYLAKVPFFNWKNGPPSKKKKISSYNFLSSKWNSAYIYLPILFIAGVVQYYGGVNEAMIAGMSLELSFYGMLYGGKSVIADSEYGKLKGFSAWSRDGREFYSFLGVPYASPPVGELRFQSPRPPAKWNDVKDATGYGPMCSQYDLFLQAVMGSEDCLTLNIYTPKLNNSNGAPLPVLFFIHGGLYHFGRTMDFHGHYFMDEDVVVVSLNYRLQAFGFLNTGDGVVRGNMGLKDQVMALRWVQKNIAYFGGDPSKVTIWGESAGGASTHLHMLSPMSKGLFHRAISNSGFSLNHWSFLRTPREHSQIFARKFGCPTHSSHEMVRCLRGISADRIAEMLRGNHDVLHPRRDLFAPTIESGLPTENDTETFLADHPRTLLRRGEIVNKVPMINGVNSHEGLIYAGYFVRNQTIVDELNSNWNKYAPILLDYADLPKRQRDEVSSKIWQYYLGNKTVNLDSLYELTNLFSDVSFNYGFEETALLFANSSTPLYLYLYNHHGEFGVAQGYFRVTMKLPLCLDGVITTGVQAFKKHILGWEEKHWGVCHADEMALFFKMHQLLSVIGQKHPEYTFSKEMVRQWVHFAVEGKTLQFQGHKWTPLRPGESLKLMKLDSQPSPGMVDAPWASRVNFLNSLPRFQCIMGRRSSKDSVCF